LFYQQLRFTYYFLTQQGTNYKISDDDTIVSKHVGAIQ